MCSSHDSFWDCLLFWLLWKITLSFSAVLAWEIHYFSFSQLAFTKVGLCRMSKEITALINIGLIYISFESINVSVTNEKASILQCISKTYFEMLNCSYDLCDYNTHIKWQPWSTFGPSWKCVSCKFWMIWIEPFADINA